MGALPRRLWAQRVAVSRSPAMAASTASWASARASFTNALTSRAISSSGTLSLRSDSSARDGVRVMGRSGADSSGREGVRVAGTSGSDERRTAVRSARHSSSMPAGLVRKACMPASMAVPAAPASALMPMITSGREGFAARNVRATEGPSISGMRRSSSTTSKRSSASRVSASRPPATHTTSCPSCSSILRPTVTLTGVSSTSSTRRAEEDRIDPPATRGASERSRAARNATSSVRARSGRRTTGPAGSPARSIHTTL